MTGPPIKEKNKLFVGLQNNANIPLPIHLYKRLPIANFIIFYHLVELTHKAETPIPLHKSHCDPKPHHSVVLT